MAASTLSTERHAVSRRCSHPMAEMLLADTLTPSRLPIEGQKSREAATTKEATREYPNQVARDVINTCDVILSMSDVTVTSQ